MDNQSQTVRELLQELAALKQRLAKLERLKAGPDPGDSLPNDGEAKYRRLFEMATIGIFQSSPEGKVITANPEFARMFGYESPEDVISSVKDIAADMYVDPQRRLEIVRLIVENPNLRSFENIYRRKDGSTFTGNLHIWPVRDGDGRLLTIEGFVEDITERKQVEEESLKSRRFLSDLIENAGALVCVKDREGRYELVNSKWEEVAGLARRDTIGRTDEELFPGPTDKAFRRNELEVMESGVVQEKEETLADEQGVRSFISIKFPLRGDDGVIRGICGMITEITARKAVEEELGLSRNRLSRAEIISRSGNWEFDLEANRVFASAGARRIYGFLDAEWTIPEVQKILLPEYRDMLDQALWGLINENHPYNLEFKIRRPDTGEIVDIHSVAEYDRHRKVVFGVIRDITEYRRTEQDLRESEELYRTFINATSDMVFLKDELLRNIVVNKTMAVFFGKPEGEIIGKSDFELMPQTAAENCRLTDLAALSGLSVVIAEEIVGGHVYETLKFPVELGKDRVGVGGFIRNITARRQAEEELSESRRRLEDIIEFLPDATLVIDQEGKVIAWNRAMETMTGVRKEDMLGKGDYEYAIPFYGIRRPILIDYALHPDKVMERQYTATRRVGDIILGEAFTPNLPPGDMHLYATASVLHDSKGKIIAAIECIRDNTERKRLAERLNRAEKMEGLGRLAGGVAHDLNNI